MTRRLLLAIAVFALGVLAGPVDAALAEPTLTIEAPAANSALKDATPVITGTSSDALDPVTVRIYSGENAVESAEAQPQALSGEWSVELPVALTDGAYSAVAEQTEGLTSQKGESSPLPFSIHASKPAVTLKGVSSPTSDTTPAFSGTASEKTPVTVYVFEGTGTGGQMVAEAHASGTGGGWSSGAASPALADGTYTAVAEQESAYENGPGFSGQVHFSVETQAPSVSLEAIESPSKQTAPSFTGFASDTTDVTVLIYRGSTVSGGAVSSASAGGTGGAWSSGAASPTLGEGTYTAVAHQTSSPGNREGQSSPIHFTVVTSPPRVTLNSIKSPSGRTTPSFTGSASDTTSISILIYRGARAEGSEFVASASAGGTGGGWTSGAAGPALSSGEYTAIAVQNSSVGNPPGESNEVTFFVDTSSPTVTLDPVSTPTRNTDPTFSGTASDSTSVVVHVFDGSDHEVASASGSPSGGRWTSGNLSRALSDGSYTAVATEASSLENPQGQSEPVSFTVSTASPRVTLNQPAQRSGVAAPSFSGTASDTTTVTVEIKGTSSGATTAASASAAGTGGAWTSSAASPELKTGTYTARAVQPSSLGNSPGISESRSFEVDTGAPKVTINHPPARSGQRSPSFSGTASESSQVVVHLLEAGHEIAKLAATPSGGTWETGALSPALPPGRHEYKVYASEESTIGNGLGRSEEVPFVLDTSSPTVTLAKPESPSKNVLPTFKGTAGEASEVTVHIFEGATEVLRYAEPVQVGSWEIHAQAPGLEGSPRHEYKVFATETSAIGNPEGRSAEEWPLVVDTTSPHVTIAPVTAISNNRAPTFSGTVSGTDPVKEPVVVHVLEAGKQVASAEAKPSGEKWSAGPVKPELAAGDHSYTVYASEASSLGNPEGSSEHLPFVVNTNPPAVTLEPVAAASNNFSPSFTGATSEAGKVLVSVYRGHAAEGSLVTTVSATAVEVPGQPGKWTWSSAAISPLEHREGTYTAIARQKSTLGNEEGKSKAQTFKVDPGLPTLALSAPPTLLATSAPSFSGTSDESPPVVVRVYARKAAETGCEPQGTVLAQATAAQGGAWSTAPASPALADGEYAAVASQTAALEAAEASTAPSCFTVDTHPPAVTLTAPAPESIVSGGSVTAAGAAGTALHDLQQVTVQLFAGATIGAGASPLEQIIVSSLGASWSATLSGLSPGTYTVRAEQADEAGNVGVSASSTFHVTAPGAATVTGPSARFTWYPPRPHTGETISLLSDSLDAASPLSAYAWALNGVTFAAGGQSLSTSFATPGNHVVALRVTDRSGRSSVVSEAIPVTYPLMHPFPIVRIVTTRTIGRVRLEVLSVRAPAGVSVEVSCTGRGCPLRSQLRKVARAHKAAVSVVTFARFERSLAPGITLHIRVFKFGEIGKYTAFTIRRGRLPVRSDSCVSSTAVKPTRCPT